MEQAEWWAEFKIFKDRDGSYYWQLQAASGRIIARSGHAYESRYWCEQDVNWLRANADQVMVYDYTRVASASGGRKRMRGGRVASRLCRAPALSPPVRQGQGSLGTRI